MTPLPGQTRTHFGARHALITPDGHVASVVPGVEKVRVVAHITPAMGAGFAQSTFFFAAGGRAPLPPSSEEYFVYIQEGRVEIVRGKKTDPLDAGSYAYLPPQTGAELRAGAAATVIVFQKKFAPVAELAPPDFFLGYADKIPGQPFLGNPRALLQVLLPDIPAFDLAVNIFTYQPGATLPFVETHVMEHGLLMLSGQGIYRLEDAWYLVAAGDVIWMAPYCPQWFVAIGDVPASYLYCKDVNRPFLAP